MQLGADRRPDANQGRARVAVGWRELRASCKTRTEASEAGLLADWRMKVGMEDGGGARGWFALCGAVASRRDTFPLEPCSAGALAGHVMFSWPCTPQDRGRSGKPRSLSLSSFSSSDAKQRRRFSPTSASTRGARFLFLTQTLQSLQLKPAMFSAARNTALRQVRSHVRLSQPVTVPQYSALARLLSTLAVLEQRDGKLNPASLSAISAGTKLGGSITAFVAGSGVKSVADEAAKVKGIEKIIYVENGAYEKVGYFRFRVLVCLPGKRMLTADPGPTRKLRSAARREHQEGRLHTHSGWTLGIRQEPAAPCCCAARHAGRFRHHWH